VGDIVKQGTYGGNNATGQGMVEADGFLCADTAPTDLTGNCYGGDEYLYLCRPGDTAYELNECRPWIVITLDDGIADGTTPDILDIRLTLDGDEHANNPKFYVYVLSRPIYPGLTGTIVAPETGSPGGPSWDEQDVMVDIAWSSGGGDYETSEAYKYGTGIIDAQIGSAGDVTINLKEYVKKHSPEWGDSIYLLLVAYDPGDASCRFFSKEQSSGTRPYVTVKHVDTPPAKLTTLATIGSDDFMDANDAYKTVPEFSWDQHAFEVDVTKFYIIYKESSAPSDPSDGTKAYVSFGSVAYTQDITDFGITNCHLVNSSGVPIAPTEGTDTYYALCIEDENHTGADAIMSNAIMVDRPVKPVVQLQKYASGAWGADDDWVVFDRVRIRTTATADDVAFLYAWGDGEKSDWLDDAAEDIGTYQYRQHTYEDTEYPAGTEITTVKVYALNHHGFSSDATSTTIDAGDEGHVGLQADSVSPGVDTAYVPRRRRMRLYIEDMVLGRAGLTISKVKVKYTQDTGSGYLTIGSIDQSGFANVGNKVKVGVLSSYTSGRTCRIIGLDTEGNIQEEQVNIPDYTDPTTYVTSTNTYRHVLAIIADHDVQDFEVIHDSPGSGTIGTFFSRTGTYIQLDLLHYVMFANDALAATVYTQLEDSDAATVEGTVGVDVVAATVLDLNVGGDLTNTTVGGRELPNMGPDASYGPVAGEKEALEEPYYRHYGLTLLELTFDANDTTDITKINRLLDGYYDWATFTIDSTVYVLWPAEDAGAAYRDGTAKNLVGSALFLARPKEDYIDGT